jgi:hypothetical protein
MTWVRQVLHVARKDVLMARWPLLAYVAVVVFATVTGLGVLMVGPASEFPGSVLLVIVGMLLVAMLVQADPPAGSDAFWVTRPLRPSAVFGAKLLLVLAVIGVGLVGQALALRAHAIPGGDYLPHLARTALVYGLWLSAAAVLAALTRDIRMFVVVGVAIFVGVTTTGMFLIPASSVLVAFEPTPWFRFIPAIPASLPPTVILLGLLAVVLHQYLTRRFVRGVVLTVVVVGLAGVLALAAAPHATHAGLATDAPAVLHARVTDARMTISDGGHAQTRANVLLRLDNPAPGHRYTLGSGEAEVRRRDGTVEEAYIDIFPAWVIVFEAGRAQDEVEFRVQLTPEQAEQLRAGAATLLVRGRIQIDDVVAIGTLPLDGSGELRIAGRRLRVVRADFHAAGPEVEVASSAVAPARGGAPSGSMWASMPSLFGWARDFAYTLVDSVSGQAVPLMHAGSGGRGGALPLPGPDSYLVRSTLGPGPGVGTDPSRGGWIENSRLHVGTWRPLGSYPVQVTPALDPRLQ